MYNNYKFVVPDSANTHQTLDETIIKDFEKEFGRITFAKK